MAPPLTEYLPILLNAGVWSGAVFLVDRINKSTVRLVNYIEKVLGALIPSGYAPAVTSSIDIGIDAIVAGFVLDLAGMKDYVGSILNKDFLFMGGLVTAGLVTALTTFLMIKLASDSTIAGEIYEKFNFVILGALLSGLALQLVF